MKVFGDFKIKYFCIEFFLISLIAQWRLQENYVW